MASVVATGAVARTKVTVTSGVVVARGATGGVAMEGITLEEEATEEEAMEAEATEAEATEEEAMEADTDLIQEGDRAVGLVAASQIDDSIAFKLKSVTSPPEGFVEQTLQVLTQSQGEDKSGSTADTCFGVKY
jgi:hypothetical protein